MGWDVVGAVSRAAARAYDEAENSIDAAGKAIDGGVRGLEHAVDDARKGIVDFGEQHGGVVGKAAGQVISSQIGLSEGAGLAVYDAAKGVVTVARGVGHLTSPAEWALHPDRNIERAHTAGNVLTSMARLGTPVSWALQPKENANTATALWNGVSAGYRDAAKSGDWSKFGGRAVVDVGSLFIGAGEANVAIKGAKGAEAAAHAAEGLGAASHAAEGVGSTARAADAVSDAAGTARAAEAVSAARAAAAPEWFKNLSWSEPVKLETLRANRNMIPSEPGVYAFTKYAGPLEKNTGVLYVGKAEEQTLRKRLPSYLPDPANVGVLSEKSGFTRVSSTLSHPGKSLLLTEVQQLSRNGAESGIWVRWLTQNSPGSLEDRLIKYLQPGLNTALR